MHFEAKHFLEFIKNNYFNYFENKNVLDVGSGDINGNNKYLFTNCTYTGNDVVFAPNVTIVSKTHLLPFINNTFDTIISSECFEHDPNYELSIKKIYDMLKEDGLFVFTCASNGRPEHGTRRTSPTDSYGTRSKLIDMQDYYKNLSQKDIEIIFDNKMQDYFSSFNFYYNSKSYDLYFVGIKKGKEQINLINYTFL